MINGNTNVKMTIRSDFLKKEEMIIQKAIKVRKGNSQLREKILVIIFIPYNVRREGKAFR